MKLLITPAQVAETAFHAPDFITADAVSETTILAAQQKFIRPVFGALYNRLCEGAYPDFVAEYIVPALALYVKLLMLPSLSVQAGTAGVVEVNSGNLAKASDTKLRYAVRRLRSDASALIECATEHVEANQAIYPEYDTRNNIRNRCSIDGQVVL